MSYVTEDFYKSIYGEISSADFLRFSLKAERVLLDYTTGVDGFEKLTEATPTDEDVLTALKMCAADLIHTMSLIAYAEKRAGVVQRSDGTVSPASVSSVSSGSESITYSVGDTAFNTAVGDSDARRTLFSGIVRDWLAGAKDANGVNLLYMGVYPRV